jgi:hypothetical protein
MEIAVIGAGWFGCHIANKLKNNHNVSLFDKSGIFSESSMKNQNRLHLGYHYARSSTTRLLCTKTFYRFKNDYENLIFSIPNNVYAIPERNSIIDFKTYLKIFEDSDFQLLDHNYLNYVSGAIGVNEKYIDPFIAQSYFNKELDDLLIIKNIEDLNSISPSYDFIINCTNNNLNPIVHQSFMQPCTIFTYEKLYDTPFDALTLVDGPLFSIFPFYKNMVTVSDVEYTPDSNLTITERIQRIEEKISYYYPEFHKKFQYRGYLNAIKTKPVDMSDNRAPVITMENNIVNCFSGKIQGIYYLEDYITQLIKGDQN